MKTVKACIFNAYGTILDTFLPFVEYRDRLDENALLIYKLWRSKRLQYSSQLSLMNKFTSYNVITKNALDFACDVYGVNDQNLKNDILHAHSNLNCYPDVEETLKTLKMNDLDIVILSNGTPQNINDTLKSTNIDELIDRVFSTEQIKAYKPSPAVYEYVEENLGIKRSNLCFISSNSWDIAGAVNYGFKSVWVNRFNRNPERLSYKANAEINSLTELQQTINYL